MNLEHRNLDAEPAPTKARWAKEPEAAAMAIPQAQANVVEGKCFYNRPFGRSETWDVCKTFSRPLTSVRTCRFLHQM